jgi:hypothetical protein
MTDGKEDPAEGSPKFDVWGSPSDASASSVSAPERYYFNLTNGDVMIRDEEGVVASSVQAAVISAMEAVEELRAQALSDPDEWRGWRLEIIEASGQAVHAIPLDALSHH